MTARRSFCLGLLLLLLLAAARDAAPFTATEYLRMAMTARQEGLYALSNEQLDAFFAAGTDHPNADYAYLLYASNLFELNQYLEAKRKLKQLLEKFPASQYRKDAMARVSLVCLETGDFTEAVEDYLLYRAAFGRDTGVETQIVDAMFNHAVRVYNGEAFERSEEFFSEIREKFPENSYPGEIAYYLGLIAYRQGRFARAAALLAEAPGRVRAEAMAADACLKLGDCAFNEGGVAEAESWYRRVIDQYPAFDLRDEAFFQLGLVLKRTGKYADADAAFAAAFDESGRDATRAKALMERGKLAMLEEKWAAAEKHLLRVTLEFPSAPEAVEALLQLGFASFNAKRYDRAVEFFRRFLDTAPDSAARPNALFGLGYAYHNRKQVDKAMEAWDRLLTEFPKSRYALEVLFLTGKRFFERGEFERAESSFERLLSDFPGEGFAAVSYPILIESLMRQKKYAEARQVSEEALKKGGGDEVLLAYGKVLAVLGDVAAAEEAFVKVGAANHVLKAEALYYLAQIAAQTGRPAKARTRYLEIMTFYPDAGEWCDRAREELRKK